MLQSFIGRMSGVPPSVWGGVAAARFRDVVERWNGERWSIPGKWLREQVQGNGCWTAFNWISGGSMARRAAPSAWKDSGAVFCKTETRLLLISRRTTLSLRAVALLYLSVLLLAPLVVVFWRTFEHGIGTAWSWMTTPAAISALWLSVLITIGMPRSRAARGRNPYRESGAAENQL